VSLNLQKKLFARLMETVACWATTPKFGEEQIVSRDTKLKWFDPASSADIRQFR